MLVTPTRLASVLEGARDARWLAPALLFALACGGGDSTGTSVTPSVPRSTPPRLTGLEIFAERTAIRTGQVVGPLVAYGRYDDGATGVVDAAWSTSDPATLRLGDDARVTGAGVGKAEVAAAFEGFAATLGFEVAAPIPRTTVDRPDDISGPQIHAVYALPSDVDDGHLDRYGDIARSFAGIQNWLREDIGYRLRLDTHGGDLDVTFVRLPFSEAEGEARGDLLLADLGDAVADAIGRSPNKVYAIYYGGRAGGVCGDAQPGGPYGAVFVDDEGCSSSSPGADPEVASTYEAVMLHELLHVFGVANPCPPHLEGGAHVGDDARDLMYAGPDREAPADAVIDAGRDDYFDHGRSDCLDTSSSPFWGAVEGRGAESRLGGRTHVRIPVVDWPLRCGLR